MRGYDTVPSELVAGWEQSVQSLSARQAIDFHYHDVEEWLSVVHGEITFFNLGDEPVHVGLGRALHIPRGEVHRADVGADGVEYRMFVPLKVAAFVKELTADEIAALRANLEFPEYEDGRAGDGSKFFEDALSNELVFCRASGVCVDKRTFLKQGFVDKGRSSTGSIQVLNRTENGLLISTLVEMTEGEGVQAYINVRFLAAERGTLRCRLWANYRNPSPVQAIA